MKFELKGIQTYDFNDAKTGKPIHGNKLHVVDTRRDGVMSISGYRVKTIPISDDLLASFMNSLHDDVIGKLVDIEFDDNKAVYAISVTK